MNLKQSTSRRRFLALTSAAAAGATFFDIPQILRAADPADRFGGWPIGIQSFSLRKFDLDQAVRHMQGLGCSAVSTSWSPSTTFASRSTTTDLALEYEANPENPIDDIQQCLAAAEESIAKAAS